MICKWAIINWTNGEQVQLCSAEEVARRLLPSHGKNHIIREVFFYDDGTKAPVYISRGERHPMQQEE